MLLAISTMGYVTMVGQLLLGLTILVILHECGHFAPARWFKTKVEKFYLFFDWPKKIVSKKFGETEYGIGMLPLGGYVKIAGMVDESFDKEQMAAPPQPWEFRSKPAWQRFIIMIGGVTVNFILGILLFSLIYWHYGEEYLPMKNAKYGIAVDTAGLALGLRNGDQILSVGNKTFEKFNEASILSSIVLDDATEIKVLRDGNEVILPISPEIKKQILKPENKHSYFGLRTLISIKEIPEKSPAAKSGIKENDQIIGINQLPVLYFDEFKKILQTRKNSSATLTVLRNQKDTVSIPVQVDSNGAIGFHANLLAGLELEKKEYGLMASFPAGWDRAMTLLSLQGKAFLRMFQGKTKVSDNLGGFGSISKIYGANWDWKNFWTITALLSMMLAFMNLLPIPGLDGGHIVFLIFEVVTGIKPSDRFVEKATMIGFVLLIALMLYANGLDVLRGCK